MPKTKSEKALEEVAVSLKTLTDAVAGIRAEVDELKKATEPKKCEEKPASQPGSVSVATPNESSKFRELVNSILNKHFSFEISDGPNPAYFNFTVMVPKKYSNASNAHWDFYKNDLRPIAVAFNQAEAMVKEHLERVFKNLGPELDALIVNDR